jgi:polyhydroxyalkanoate synthesis regulator phasin
MNKLTRWVGVLLAGVVIVALVLGVMAFKFMSNASAKASPVRSTSFAVFRGRGGPGFPANPGAEQEALANALGISVAQLQTAQQQANDNAIQEAVKQGLITQEQADNMILRGYGFGRGFDGRGIFGANSNIDYNQLLADALNISLDKLQAAQKTALKSVLDQAVANGTMTQAQADLIEAQQALQSYIDPNAIFANALGISTEQLQTYRDQGMTLTQILNQVGKTAIEVRDAEQAAYQAGVAKAVSDKAITQAQADQVLASGFRGGGGFAGVGGFGCGPDFGGRGGRGHGGFGGFNGGLRGFPKSGPNSAPSTAPTATPGGGI